jgi:osmotically-inducible protein OsmY
MKKVSFRLIVIGIAIAVTTTAGLGSCKGKSDKSTTTTVDSPATQQPAPVEISPDENLRTAVKDATKDYPTVTATVANGEVTLTGTLERSKLQKLMQTLQSLNPKKVNNQLTLN